METSDSTQPPLHDAERFRALGHRVVDLLADHLGRVRSGEVPALPRSGPTPERAEWASLPLQGREDPVALFERAVARAHQIQSPLSHGHQVAVPLPEAALAELVAGLLNNSTAIFDMAPAGTAMEERLVAWLGEALGWPETRGGALVAGGSLGNLTALLALRQAQVPGDAFGEGVDGRQWCVISSAQTHYCVRRAVQILGWGTDGLLECPVDDRFRLDPTALEDCLGRAQALGRRVLAVVASAGSTSTGAIDPLTPIADFCQAEGLWLHVDGAHGASLALSPRARGRLAGIERADSVVWDAHKFMLTPNLCTAILVRDARRLDQAFAQQADYLFRAEKGLDHARHTIECTKPWSGLKLWAVLGALGSEGLADYLDRQLEVVAAFAQEIEASPDFECAHVPDLNILCFRHRPSGLSEGPELDAHQDRLRGRVIGETTHYLTRTVLHGQVWLRVTVLHPETGLDVLRALLAALRGAAA